LANGIKITHSYLGREGKALTDTQRTL